MGRLYCSLLWYQHICYRYFKNFSDQLERQILSLGENLGMCNRPFCYIYKRVWVEPCLCTFSLHSFGNQNNQDVIQNQPAASKCFELNNIKIFTYTIIIVLITKETHGLSRFWLCTTLVEALTPLNRAFQKNKGRFCNTIASVALVHTSIQSD